MERVSLRGLTALCLLFTGCVTSEREVSAGAPGVTGSALVSGAACDAANANGVASRYERALLDTIAYTEGTKGRGKDGYNVMFAYRTFDSCEEHPNTKVCSGSYCSTAAGRYQFLAKTYDGLNMDSFWPEAQERAALELIRRRGVTLPTGALSATQFANALDRLSYEWASLPPSRYGQGHFTMDQVRDEYCDYARCGELAAPAIGSSSSASASVAVRAGSFVTIERDGMMYRYQSDGHGRFTSRALTSGWDSVTAMGAGADYDEDGIADIVTMDFQYGLELQLGDGADDYQYLPVTLETGELVVIGAGADYDEDGHADFIATDDSGALVMARGDGRGQFSVEVLSRRGDAVASIGGGVDYDGDGRADFVTLQSDGSVLLYPGDGGGYFDVRQIELDGSRLSLLGGGADYDGDGLGDLIATAADGSGYLYAGNGDGTFEARLLGAGWDWILFID
jgi:muramidase (phage lysozyme)